MNGIRHTILKFVLNGRGAQQEKVLFDQFGCGVQGISTSVDSCCGLVVDIRPFLILCLRNFAVGDTKRPETFCRVVLLNYHKIMSNEENKEYKPQGEQESSLYTVDFDLDAPK